MGLYAPILGDGKSFDLSIIGLFGCGAVLGLMAFSRLLSWLLHHYRSQTFCFAERLYGRFTGESMAMERDLTDAD